MTISTLDLLKCRKAAGSLPGRRYDQYYLALAIEGGGMRAAITSAMVAALEWFGYLKCFDSVTATSAGAITAAYFLAEQGVANAPMYPSQLATRRFINKFRLLRGLQPIMDLNYLMQDMMIHQHPLDAQKVLQCGIKPIIVATALETGEPVVLDGFRSRRSLLGALRASATIPRITTAGPTNFRRMALVDGGFSTQLPIQIARSHGATHILALTNVPQGQWHPAAGRIDIHLVCSALAKCRSPIANAFPQLHQQHNAELRALREAKDPTLAFCEVPSSVPFLNTLCNTPDLLWHALEEGFKAACNMLGYPNQGIPKLWQELRHV